MRDTKRGTRAWADEYTLLCERCGYVINGLPTDGVCPECGLGIEKSLPANRQGTPWQRLGGPVPMMSTWWMTLRHPARTLDQLAVGPPRIRRLLLLAGLPIGLLLGAVLMLVFEMERPLPNGGSVAWSPGSAVGAFALSVVMGVLLTPVAAAVLAGMTWIEARGLVIFGAQRSVRMEPDLAHTIVRHGAVGWLLCGAGAAMALPLAWSLEVELGFARGRRVAVEPPAWTIVSAYAGFLVAALGFLWFEFFAWFGLRRCKFANRSRPSGSPAATDPLV